MIEIKNVSKKFKEIVLFENISAIFENGKKILIKGPNATGKSVLLKMLVGYSTPNSGEIIVDNYRIGLDEDFILEAGVSINAPEFCNNWTGLENLLYLSNIRKIASKDKIIEICKNLDLDHVLNKKYKTYSLGMRQKMRLVQALMDKPKYLIVDEPFDALDLKSQEKVVNMLNDFMNKDKTLIFTTHNSEYEKFADEIYEIKDLKLNKLSNKNNYIQN